MNMWEQCRKGEGFYPGVRPRYLVWILFLGSLLELPVTAATLGWQQINLGTYSGSNLKTVGGVSGIEIFFGGSSSGAGLILKYDGASLTPMTLPVGSLDIRGIAGDHAISNGDTLLRRNGPAWEPLAITIASPVDLRSISASGNLVVAAGNNGERLRLENGAVTLNTKSSTYRFSDTWGADSQHYYVAGVDAFTGDPVLLFYYYDSSTSSWALPILNSPGAANSFGYIYGIPSGNTMGEVFGVGGHNKILHYVPGSGWSPMSHPKENDSFFKFYGIHGDGTALYAYGHDGSWGTILRYANGTWTNVTPEGMSLVYDLWGTGGELYVAARNQIWRYGPMLPQYQLSMDVIQTIQDPVKYVTGKAIYVRAYITCSNCDVGSDVNATVRLTVGTATTAISKQMPIDPVDTVASLRDQPAMSYNFQIPDKLFETDTSVVKDLQLHLEANDGSGLVTRDLTRAITVEHQDPLLVGVIRVRIINGANQYLVDAGDLANSERFMEMVYPGKLVFLHLGNVDIDVTDITDLPAETATDGSGNLTPAAQALRKTNEDLRTTLVRHYLARLHLHHLFKNTPGFAAADYVYGIWSPDAPSMPGLADAYYWPDHLSGYVSHGPPGTYMAHEVGHSLGLQHTVWMDTGTQVTENRNIFQGQCPKRDNPAELNPDKADVVMTDVPAWVDYSWGKNNPFTGVYGYEVGLAAKVAETNYFDFMSYCGTGLDIDLQSGVLKDTDEWVSDIHYNRLLGVLAGTNLPHGTAAIDPPGKKIGKLPADKAFFYTPEAVSRYLISRARLHDNGTATGMFAEEVEGNIALPRSTLAATATNYCVETRNAANAVLDSQCFNPIFRNANLEPTDSVSIQANLNADPAVNAVVIRKGSTVIGNLVRSANAPVVSGLSVASATPAERRFCWSATDADGGPLSYLLEYSADQRTHWQPVALDWAEACYTFDLRSLPASTAGRIRIIPSDGFNAGSPMESAVPFAVADQGPEITLAHARVVCDLEPGLPFLLSARATDTEDGAISDVAITWEDGNGQVLGAVEVQVTISAPTEYFRVKVSDSAGNRSEQEVILNLPTGIANDVDCDSMADDYELTHGLDPALHDAAGDLDQDLLANIEEYRGGTDPNDSDSDNDGQQDGMEVTAGRNPLLNEGVIIQILNNMDED